MTAVRDPAYRQAVNAFDIAAPDGQPVRWAMNRIHGAGLCDRVYGPELMLRLCRRAAREGVSIYLYGSTPDVLAQLSQSLRHSCPGLVIAGTQSPPFRALSETETRQVIETLNHSGAGLVFIGLGCPRQDLFVDRIRRQVDAVLLCVGAAFDFLGGNKRMAPPWMQRAGFEWLFRLAQEPGRLWQRYLVTNSIFLWLLARRLTRGA